MLGTGPGRGVGLMFVLAAVVLLGGSLLAYLNPRIRHVEEELPDAVAAAEAPMETVTAQAVAAGASA
jgi:hypothetical protein